MIDILRLSSFFTALRVCVCEQIDAFACGCAADIDEYLCMFSSLWHPSDYSSSIHSIVHSIVFLIHPPPPQSLWRANPLSIRQIRRNAHEQIIIIDYRRSVPLKRHRAKVART